MKIKYNFQCDQVFGNTRADFLNSIQVIGPFESLELLRTSMPHEMFFGTGFGGNLVEYWLRHIY
jgi:hypothetical protein